MVKKEPPIPIPMESGQINTDGFGGRKKVKHGEPRRVCRLKMASGNRYSNNSS